MTVRNVMPRHCSYSDTIVPVHRCYGEEVNHVGAPVSRHLCSLLPNGCASGGTQLPSGRPSRKV